MKIISDTYKIYLDEEKTLLFGSDQRDKALITVTRSERILPAVIDLLDMNENELSLMHSLVTSRMFDSIISYLLSIQRTGRGEAHGQG